LRFVLVWHSRLQKKVKVKHARNLFQILVNSKIKKHYKMFINVVMDWLVEGCI